MTDPAPTQQLAADEALAVMEHAYKWGLLKEHPTFRAALDALVARITDLEADQRRWLAWSGGDYPDDSPGDVISYETDGTIVLDDGITTWNPLRALATAEAQVASLREMCAAHTQNEMELADRVATLTQERDEALAALHPHSAAVVLKAARAESAEAALAETNQAWAATGRKLATTRQALTEIDAADVDWTQGVDENCERLKDIARRALAAAEDTQ